VVACWTTAFLSAAGDAVSTVDCDPARRRAEAAFERGGVGEAVLKNKRKTERGQRRTRKERRGRDAPIAAFRRRRRRGRGRVREVVLVVVLFQLMLIDQFPQPHVLLVVRLRPSLPLTLTALQAKRRWWSGRERDGICGGVGKDGGRCGRGRGRKGGRERRRGDDVDEVDEGEEGRGSG
jgi:hypothetical protein